MEIPGFTTFPNSSFVDLFKYHNSSKIIIVAAIKPTIKFSLYNFGNYIANFIFQWIPSDAILVASFNATMLAWNLCVPLDFPYSNFR